MCCRQGNYAAARLLYYRQRQRRLLFPHRALSLCESEQRQLLYNDFEKKRGGWSTTVLVRNGATHFTGRDSTRRQRVNVDRLHWHRVHEELTLIIRCTVEDNGTATYSKRTLRPLARHPGTIIKTATCGITTGLVRTALCSSFTASTAETHSRYTRSLVQDVILQQQNQGPRYLDSSVFPVSRTPRSSVILSIKQTDRIIHHLFFSRSRTYPHFKSNLFSVPLPTRAISA